MVTTFTAKRALIVIDVQNEYFSGNLPLEYPSPDETLTNIGLVMDKAREAGIPVIVVQQTSPADAPLFAVDSDGWQLHPPWLHVRTLFC
ncbi:isochorismatase family protein [Pantoea ananatis]